MTPTNLTLYVLSALLLTTILGIAILYMRRESTKTPAPRAVVKRVPARRKPVPASRPHLPYVQPERALESVLEAPGFDELADFVSYDMLTNPHEWEWELVPEPIIEVFTMPVCWERLFNVLLHAPIVPQSVPECTAFVPNDNPTQPLTLAMLGIIRCKRRDIGRKPVRDLPVLHYNAPECKSYQPALVTEPININDWLARAVGPTVEIEIEPTQLDMEREVQLRAIMPTDEPQSNTRAIVADNEGIDASLIQAGLNDRQSFEPVALRELADNIAAHGLAQPITVRPIANERFEIVAGERRFRAMTEVLGWTTIPKNYVLVRTLSDSQAAAIMLAENLMRSDLNPIDEAHAYDKRMKQFGWSVSGIADHAKVPVSRVKSRLALLSLIPDAQELIKSGNMSTGYAELMANLDVNRQAKAMEYMVRAERPSIQQFRELCSQMLEVQTQQTLDNFNIEDFIVKGAERYAAEIARKQTRRFPVSDRLPAMPKAQSTGLAIERFIALLLESDQADIRDAASVVGAVYSGLLAQGHAKRPTASPLDTITNTVELELVAA